MYPSYGLSSDAELASNGAASQSYSGFLLDGTENNPATSFRGINLERYLFLLVFFGGVEWDCGRWTLRCLFCYFTERRLIPSYDTIHHEDVRVMNNTPIPSDTCLL